MKAARAAARESPDSKEHHDETHDFGKSGQMRFHKIANEKGAHANERERESHAGDKRKGHPRNTLFRRLKRASEERR